MHKRTRCARVARGVVRERRRDERRQGAYRCGWVEQRQPRRIRLGRGIAVGVGLADRSNRPPELPVVLVIPAADRGISRG